MTSSGDLVAFPLQQTAFGQCCFAIPHISIALELQCLMNKQLIGIYILPRLAWRAWLDGC